MSEVVVVGAGSAGVAAAVAAAETGAHVVLVERTGAVGGTLVWQLLEHSAGFHDVTGKKVVAGFGQRVVDLLASYGGSPGHVRDDVGYTATRTPVNHVELSMAESVMLARSGVELALNSPVVAVERTGSMLRSLTMQTPTGPRVLKPSMVVDASGDAVVASLAGASMQPDTAARQPVSVLLKLSGVNFGPLLRYARQHPEEFRDGSVIGEPTDEHANLWGFRSLLRAGHDAGALSWLRTEMHLACWPSRGEAVINLTRVPARNAADQAGPAWLALSQQVLEATDWFRRSVPGGANATLAAVADRVGVRESRRVVGHVTLTRDDVLQGRQWPDAVALGAFPIDIHDASAPGLSHTEAPPVSYQIPLRSLVAAEVDNLLVAGRIVSSTHEANGSLRITATCFATGEAAGVAASLAASKRRAPFDCAEETRATLLERGALLEPIPDRPLATSGGSASAVS